MTMPLSATCKKVQQMTLGHFELKTYQNGELVQGVFDGTPMASVYSPKDKSGSFTKFTTANFDKEIVAWVGALQSTYGADFAQLGIKLLTTGPLEEKIKKALAGKWFGKLVVAKFAATDWQECFFYTDSGRLRVAPVEKPAVVTNLTKAQSASPSLTKSASSVANTQRVSSTRPGSANALGTPLAELSQKTNPSASKAAARDLQKKIRVLIVDDSKTIRQILRKIIESSDRLVVAAEVDRPSLVEKAIIDHKPDVMTLDIRMPEMTGVELIRKMFPTRFIPTIMISSLSIDEGHEVLDALEIGAVDYIQKPEAREILSLTPVIHEKLIGAAGVRARAKKQVAGTSRILKSAAGHAPQASLKRTASTESFLAIGASTGGTEAIKAIFVDLPANVPPIAVVQHIPAHFSAAFAKRLNEICRFEVREAKDGDIFLPGLALIAPGGLHLEVVKDGNKLVARISDGPAVNRFKPSVDVLFNSVAKVLGDKATGVILTGMGMDGAKGLLAMRNAGAFTIAQDEESSVVFGMPKVAIEVGAVHAIRPLDEIGATMLTPAIAS